MEKYLYFNGGEYFGPVNSKNEPHGFGRFEDKKTGYVYNMEWVNGVPHGDGCYDPSEGGTVYCHWEHGSIEGRAEYYAPDGSVIEVFFKNNKILSQKRIK